MLHQHTQTAPSKEKGFTLVELIVSVSIFVFMTAFLVAKYGTFNQNVLVTNTAYDVALTIRNAQAYGLNVKGVGDAPSESFKNAFGVHFELATTTVNLFSVSVTDVAYDSVSKVVLFESLMKKGVTIQDICLDDGSGLTCGVTSADVMFRRPDPNAIIKDTATGLTYGYVSIKIAAPDESSKRIIVRSTGQISIED